MAGELQTNDRGDVIRFDGQSWVPADIAVNDKTGQRMAFDGQSWVDLPGPQKSAGSRIIDKLTDAATYGPLGMAAKAVDALSKGTSIPTDFGAGLDNLKTGAIKGISGLASLPQTIIDAPSQIAGAINGQNVTPPSQALEKATGLPWLPNQSQVQGAITQAPTAIGLPQINMRTAQSSGGRLLQDVGQAIGSAPFAPMMGYNLAGGAGSFGAGEISDQNPWAKALGALGGAGLYGAYQQTAPTAVSMLSRRLKEYTPAELNAGEALQREAQARGIQLMPQEVLDRARSDPMAQLAGTAAVQPQGRPIQQLAAGRVAPGGSIPTAIEDAASAIGPRVTNPNEVARGLGDAADAAVRAPQQARAAVADPFYTAARNDAVQPAVTQTLVASIDDALQGVLPQGEAATNLRRLRSMLATTPPQTKAPTLATLDSDIASLRVPDATKLRMQADRVPVVEPKFETNVGKLDEALKELEHIIKAKAFDGKPLVPDTVRVNMQPILADVRSGLVEGSQNYRKGIEVYKGTSGNPSPLTTAVEQAQASPAARIAKAQTDPASEGALSAFDNAILRNKLDPAVVKSEIARLNAQDPQAARDALRALIQRHADDAFKITKEGVPPTDSGVGFVKNIAGTKDTRAALLAAVEGVTGNQTTAKGFDRLLEIVQRTGVTPGIGSPTVTRGAIQNEAAQGGLVNFGLQGVNLARGGPLGMLQNINELARAGKAWGQLADLFEQPDSLAKIRQLALINPKSEKAKALAATILQGAGRAPPTTGSSR